MIHWLMKTVQFYKINNMYKIDETCLSQYNCGKSLINILKEHNKNSYNKFVTLHNYRFFNMLSSLNDIKDKSRHYTMLTIYLHSFVESINKSKVNPNVKSHYLNFIKTVYKEECKKIK